MIRAYAYLIADCLLAAEAVYITWGDMFRRVLPEEFRVMKIGVHRGSSVVFGGESQMRKGKESRSGPIKG